MSYRAFSAEIESMAQVWSTSAMTTDIWTPTGQTFGTNSQPIVVTNQNNIRGVAKPGAPIPDRCLRAAHEKIVSDLAYVLGLPVPPVILWDRGAGHVGDRWCAVSAWAFSKAAEWPQVRAKLSAKQLTEATKIAGAMRAFDTWISAGDRRDDHVLADDSDAGDALGLAYIDYAFALSFEWCGVTGAQPEPRPAFPSGIGFDANVCLETSQLIVNIEELTIAEIVNRIPAEYFFDGARDATLSGLLTRRKSLAGWLT
jgi:hypothetical protein